MKRFTTHKKMREIEGALENKMIFFPRALPPYEVYAFGMSKTWATYC